MCDCTVVFKFTKQNIFTIFGFPRAIISDEKIILIISNLGPY